MATMGAPQTLDAELIVAAQCELAESPVWDTGRQRLRWVDILAGQIHSFDPADGSRGQFSVGMPVGAVGLTTGGDLVLALVDGLALAGPDGNYLTRLPGLRTDERAVRFNDGKPDPWGGFCAGTMKWFPRGSGGRPPDEQSGTEPGCLYRLAPDGSVSELVTGVGISNGLDWSDDRRSFYYVDSPAGGVDVFSTDPGSGALLGRQRFVDIPPAEGSADGLTIDADGCIWVAIWGSGEVRRYTPAGRVDTIVRLPAREVTSVAFGGPDLTLLFITTAREHLTAAELAAQPHSGDIFGCTPGVSGRVPFRFESERLENPGSRA
jgi:sugar lactone lactonase YvrE